MPGGMLIPVNLSRNTLIKQRFPLRQEGQPLEGPPPPGRPPNSPCATLLCLCMGGVCSCICVLPRLDASGLGTMSLLCPQNLVQGQVGVGAPQIGSNWDSWPSPCCGASRVRHCKDPEDGSGHCPKRAPRRKTRRGQQRGVVWTEGGCTRDSGHLACTVGTDRS